MRDVISGCACFVCVLLRFDRKVILPVYVIITYFYVYRYAYLFLRDRLSTRNIQ